MTKVSFTVITDENKIAQVSITQTHHVDNSMFTLDKFALLANKDVCRRGEKIYINSSRYIDTSTAGTKVYSKIHNNVAW